MKTFLRVAALGVAIGGLVIGMRLAPDAEARQGMPAADATALWNYLQAQNFTSWQLFPGTSRQQAGNMPHGAMVTLYANDTAQRGPLGSGTLPNGSIIVKENYMPDRTLAATTVMYKSGGFDPEHNDWFWLQRLADGTVRASGRVEGCQNCHGQAAARDYVMTEAP